MPQLDTSTFISQLFWLVVTFTLLYFAMVKIALPALREVLQTRQDRITHDLEKAELAQKEAEAAKGSYTAVLEKARHSAVSLLTETANKLKKETAARHAELDAAIEKQIAEAETQVMAAKSEAIKAAEPLATQLAAQFIQKLLHKPYAEEEIATVVQNSNRALKH